MGSRSRRSFLTLVTGGSAVGVAGCLGDNDAVSVLAAGSLSVILDDHIGRQFEAETAVTYHGEYFGTNVIMRMIEDRQANPDVVVSADNVLLRDRLYGTHTEWDVEFAANSIGLAYAPDTEVGSRLAAGEPWYEILADVDDGEIAISDPDLDPLGYRAILAFRLAEAEHDLGGLADRLATGAYREPDEPQLLAGVETGNRAAAVAYRNMAVDHGLPFVEFPDAYNFSNPGYSEQYGRVSYTTDDGYTATGAPIVYNATVLNRADNPAFGHTFVRFLADAHTTLQDNGLSVNGFPTPHGAVPAEVLSK